MLIWWTKVWFTKKINYKNLEVKTEPAESSSSSQSQQPPWMKEMKEKKSFGKKEENEYHQPPPVEPVKVKYLLLVDFTY